jgi:carboxypeptidase Taq
MSSPSSSAYSRLRSRLRRAHVLESVASVLGWDEQVNLPEGSAACRAEQMTVLAEILHAAATDPDLDAALRELEATPARLRPGGASAVPLRR